MNTKNAQTLPYGSWTSPITAELVAGKSLRLGQPRIHGDAVYWTETRPQEMGRTTLVKWTIDSGCQDLVPPPYSLQSKVHGYGGGVFAVNGDIAWFVNKYDQCVYEVRDGTTGVLTRNSTRCFGDLVHDAHRNRLLAVCENQDPALSEPENSIVAIDCRTGELETLLSGNDFYSSPRIAPDGKRLTWLEWQHPDMPWDATRLYVAEFDARGIPHDAQLLAGGDDESVLQPTWRDNDEIVFVSDRTDWWNLYAWNDGTVRELHRMNAEFAVPHWVFGTSTFGFRGSDRLACAYTSNGIWRFAELDLQSGAWREHELPYTQIDHVHASGGKVVLHASGVAQPATIVLLGENETAEELRHAAEVTLDEAFLQPPQSITFSTGDNETAHGLYYAPANPGFAADADSAPPLLVKAHGGPTAASSPALDMKIRYWTSRGFAVLDVNYRGSTGYGRKFRKSLYGRWGIADVEDCVNGARHLATRGLADSQRLLISGSSAGGYTVLAALTFHDVFAGGASYYGVADPITVMRDTEKFESRYGDQLIGPLPETESIWRERSPLFNSEKLDRPVIFLQGLEDRIVPPDQSERMFEAARAKGLETFYIAFPGEGHGFRGAETIATALRAEYAFYCRILRICASETLPELEQLATRGSVSS